MTERPREVLLLERGRWRFQYIYCEPCPPLCRILDATPAAPTKRRRQPSRLWHCHTGHVAMRSERAKCAEHDKDTFTRAHCTGFAPGTNHRNEPASSRRCTIKEHTHSTRAWAREKTEVGRPDAQSKRKAHRKMSGKTPPTQQTRDVNPKQNTKQRFHKVSGETPTTHSRLAMLSPSRTRSTGLARGGEKRSPPTHSRLAMVRFWQSGSSTKFAQNTNATYTERWIYAPWEVFVGTARRTRGVF